MAYPLESSSAVDPMGLLLQEIGSESNATVRERERSAFDQVAGPFSKQLVLFGAGHLGRFVLKGLRQCGLEPLAFADNNQRLWGTEVNCLRVISPQEAARQYGASACFVVTIYNGCVARRQLRDLGCRRVAPFALLFWKYAAVFVPHSGIDLPHRLREHFDSMRRCYDILGDEHSRRELRDQLRWRSRLEYDALSAASDPRDTYFPFDLITPSEEEVFVDCGGFDGDTVRSFSEHWNGRFKRALTFEPDPSNRAALLRNVEAIGIRERVTVMPYAVGNENGTVYFSLTSSAASHRVEDGAATPVECRRLDDIDWPETPTYIKMDIEGAELDAIRGAAGSLLRHQPILAICTYHRSNHLWDIPNLIHSINPNYRLFLRRYAEECWEGVCYAIPEARLRKA